MPKIAVIVMAVDSNPLALEALASIPSDVEKILVNTGNGSLSAELCAQDGEGRVKLIESPDKRMPGGTRNLGISACSAPIVSFLAADCLIAEGSLDERIKAHERGFDLVSSSLRPYANTIASWACYVYIHYRRMPERVSPKGAIFGVSYKRDVFQRVGVFNDEMRVAEDAEFNQRCEGMRILFARNIVTYHRYPESLISAIADVSARAVRDMRHKRRSPPRQAFAEVIKSLRMAIVVSLNPNFPIRARKAAVLLPLLGLGAAAGCFSSYFHKKDL